MKDYHIQIQRDQNTQTIKDCSITKILEYIELFLRSLPGDQSNL